MEIKPVVFEIGIELYGYYLAVLQVSKVEIK